SIIFPSRGTLQRLSGEASVPGSDIEYYKVSYLIGRYWPVTDTSSLRARLEYGFGNGYGDTSTLPFFKNFYAGGVSTVRGYRASSLGPRDAVVDQTVGGNRRVLTNVELFFPVPGVTRDEKSMRLSTFVDGGMVYGPSERLELGELRYSAGLAFNWFSPVGPLSFSYAVPLNKQSGDQIEGFQFTLGVPFR
ncbi:MAG: BamA/TamA family outer membrane protein, partial [Sulfurifustaceae bacterium]